MARIFNAVRAENTPPRHARGDFKQALKGLCLCVAALLLAATGLVAWLTAAEFRPAAVEELAVQGTTEGPPPAAGDRITVLTLNTGYAGLGADADFFMDGGSGVNPTAAQVERNLTGLMQQLDGQTADVWFLQEVDTGSARSGSQDQSALYQERFRETSGGDCAGSYALNYACPFVPYPLPPIGKVRSGLQTLTRFPVSGARRVALPCPFRWPVSTANLKRCLLVNDVPLADASAQLVLVNLHLEAYDGGEGKAAQTEMLLDFLTGEYEKGNYVIAGGDFNQTFPGALEAFPIRTEDLWTPGVLEAALLPQGWQFACDLGTPSCRLLNQAYDPAAADTQFYVIDGFLLSPNVRLEAVETLDGRFAWTDHNPVRLEVTLEEG